MSEAAAVDVPGAPVESRWTPEFPLDLAGTLRSLVRGHGDPAHRTGRDGTFWWAAHTPCGPGTLAVRASGGQVRSWAWGPGAGWLTEGVPRLLGRDDDWSTLDVSGVPVLADTLRRSPGVRLAHTRLVFDSLLPAVLEQKVTGTQARSAWRSLLYRHGAPAPGPRPDLRLMPTPAQVLAVPTWDWHRFGVDISRQRTIRAAATVAARMEECVALGPVDGLRRLRHVPGIGPWTAAETLQRAIGHPDAVSVGDFHIPSLVVHVLTGRARATDEEMLAVLEPWRGQRQRVVRLVEMCGIRKPAFGPRYSPQDMRRF